MLSRDYHRTVLPPGTKLTKVRPDDPKEQPGQLDIVNDHLALMGWPAVEASALGRIRRIAKVEHTPAAVKAHRERMRAVESAATA